MTDSAQIETTTEDVVDINESTKKMKLKFLDDLDEFIADFMKNSENDVKMTWDYVIEMLVAKARHYAFLQYPQVNPEKILLHLYNQMLLKYDFIHAVVMDEIKKSQEKLACTNQSSGEPST